METIFRRYRRKQGEVWQLARQESPVWSEPEEGGPPYRPLSVACLSVRTRRLEISPGGAGEPEPETFLESVVQAARAWKLRPERIEVADTRIAESLGNLLAPEKMAVVVRNDLPELRAVLEDQARAIRSFLPPGALAHAGVTVEQMTSFARAVVLFAEAAPWRHLGAVDLVALDAPGLPATLQNVRVLDPPLLGLLFHPEEPEDREDDWDEDEDDWEEDDWDEDDQDEDDWDEVVDEAARLEELFFEEGLWQINLVPLLAMPPEEVELWVRHELPLASSTAYPLIYRTGEGGPGPPSAAVLSWFEAVLTALASTTETELDAGAWEKEVALAEGPVRIGLALPDVLEPAWADSAPEELVATPEALADELVTEAMNADGRRRIHLARRAIDLFPDCIGAWFVLAEANAFDPEAARDLYARAVILSEPALQALLEEGPLPEKGRPAIIPYLRARIGLARTLWEMGAREETVEHFRAMLAIDPANRELHYRLAYALLALDRNREADEHLTRIEENFTDWYYLRALTTFRLEGDSPAARRQLAVALDADRHVAKRLLDPWKKPVDRKEADADDHVTLFQDLWTDTPGALDWLRAQRAGPARIRKKKDKEKKKRKRRR